MKKYSNQNILFIIILIGFIFLMLNYENLNPIKKLIEGNRNIKSGDIPGKIEKIQDKIDELLKEVKPEESGNKKNMNEFYNEERKKAAKVLIKDHTDIYLLNNSNGDYNDYKNIKKKNEEWYNDLKKFDDMAKTLLALIAMEDNLNLDLYTIIKDKVKNQ